MVLPGKVIWSYVVSFAWRVFRLATSGGNYVWQVRNADPQPVLDSDLLRVRGDLEIASTSEGATGSPRHRRGQLATSMQTVSLIVPISIDLAQTDSRLSARQVPLCQNLARTYCASW